LNQKYLDELFECLNAGTGSGRIPKDFAAQGHMPTLQELLAALENPPVSREKFQAMRNLFLHSLTGNVDAMNAALMMRLLGEMAAGEIVLLGKLYSLLKTPESKEAPTAAIPWLGFVAQKCGYKVPALVEFDEQAMVRHKVLSPRVHGDQSGVEPGDYGLRFTSLGIALAEFIAKGEDALK
jgi:hypothetical protein